jgi:hypothetical protein
VVTEGGLSITPEMIATAEQTDEDENWWEVRGYGVAFRFEPQGAASAFGPDGFTAEQWAAHHDAVHEREAARAAKAREQRGR